MRTVVLASNTMPVRAVLRKPVCSTSIRYVPGARLANAKKPLSLVVSVSRRLVLTSVRLTGTEDGPLEELSIPWNGRQQQGGKNRYSGGRKPLKVHLKPPF